MTERPDRTWVEQAACRDEPVSKFIDPAGDSEVRAALATCRRCPVRGPCLATALNHRLEADVGIWGGTTEDQRRQIRRDRLQPDTLLDANGQQAPDPPQTTPPGRSRTRPPRPQPIPRLAAPEVTVARDTHGDYVSADGRVLIFRVQAELPWVLAIDDEIIGAHRTVTEARRTAWAALNDDGRTTAVATRAARSEPHSLGARRG